MRILFAPGGDHYGPNWVFSLLSELSGLDNLDNGGDTLGCMMIVTWGESLIIDGQ